MARPKKKDDYGFEESEVQEAVQPQAQKPSINQAMAQANMELNKGEKSRKKLYQKYKDEEKIPMYLSPMYRPYFGNVMQVSINGVSIYFKVDGSNQLVPQTFADEITSRRLKIDAILTKQKRMAEASSNVEDSPGELKLF